MRKMVLLALALVLLGGLVAACAPAATPTPTEAVPTEAPESPTIAAIKEAGKLRAGYGIGLPTLGQNPETGELFGPVIEIGKWLAEGLGVELEPVESSWDVMVAGLQANKYDVAIAAMYATEERKEVIDFVTWTEMGFCHLVRIDNDKIQTVEDLNSADVIFAEFTGTGTEQTVMREYPLAQIDSIVSPAGGITRIEEVLAGRADACTLDSPQVLAYVQEFPEVRALPVSADYCYEHPVAPTPVGIGLNYGDPVFKEYIQSVVDEHQDEINELLKQYSSPEYLRPPE